MSHKSLREMKDEDLTPPAEPEEQEEAPEEQPPTEEKDFLTAAWDWLNED
jgi:hypothetical protein